MDFMTRHADYTQVHKLAIDAARKSGVKHIFYSSLGFAGKTSDSLAYVMFAHLDTEKYLSAIAGEDSSFTYTIVRQGLYTESLGMYLSYLNLKNPPNEVLIPHDGSGPGISWVKREELGEGTAHLLKAYFDAPEAFPFINDKILLSGPREISLKESVEIIGRAVGKDLKIKPVSVNEWALQDAIKADKVYLVGEMTKNWATVYPALRRGEAAVVTEHLRRLLGREPESFEKTIADIVKA